MDDKEIWDEIARLYADAYDSSSRHLERYISLRDNSTGIKPGSIDELRAVTQLALEMLASSLEESANLRFLRIEEDSDWDRPIARYIVEYKNNICENPDEELDPIQGWLGDLTAEGMLPNAAKEPLPSFEILSWNTKNRNKFEKPV